MWKSYISVDLHVEELKRKNEYPLHQWYTIDLHYTKVVTRDLK